MSRRVRLTAKNNVQAAVDKTPYPGDVNQTRTDPDIGKYHTFEQTVNHELPDNRTEWREDSRDEIGFGVPSTETAIRTAASKAVKLAIHLLGEKVDPKTIEAQATELMALGSKALTASLMRIADTEHLYASDDVVPPMPPMPPKVEDKKDEVKAADDKPEDKKDDKKAPCACKASTEVKAFDDVVPPAPPKVEDKKDEVKADDSAADDMEDTDVPPDVTAGDEGGLDIELNDNSKAPDTVVAGGLPDDMWDTKDDVKAEEEEVEEKPKKPVASKKEGAKSIGGQPRLSNSKVVKASSENDLSKLWEDAPDLDIFG